MSVWNWFLHVIGVRPAPYSGGGANAFWGGFGSDITEFSGLAIAWHLLRCHEEGCMRIGHKLTVEPNGHHFRRCSRCHRLRHQ